MMKEIYFAGGCFWGTEHYLKQIRGVITTEVGFANGNIENPSYEQVYTDTTGHAETVHVTYNPGEISLTFLTQLYFNAIDPTSINQQGPDQGTRYRTGVYYVDNRDRIIIEAVFKEVQIHYSAPLSVELLPLKSFYTAEEYHQNYLEKNPKGYCHLPTELFSFAKQANQIKETKN